MIMPINPTWQAPDWPVPIPEWEDSPRTVSAGDSPLEKKDQQYDSRDTRVVSWKLGENLGIPLDTKNKTGRRQA